MNRSQLAGLCQQYTLTEISAALRWAVENGQIEQQGTKKGACYRRLVEYFGMTTARLSAVEEDVLVQKCHELEKGNKILRQECEDIEERNKTSRADVRNLQRQLGDSEEALCQFQEKTLAYAQHRAEAKQTQPLQ